MVLTPQSVAQRSKEEKVVGRRNEDRKMDNDQGKTTSYVGTRERHHNHLLEELFSYLHSNPEGAKRKLFHSKIPPRKSKGRCCFVDKNTGSRCENDTFREFCDNHSQKCARALARYQTACHKHDPDEANESYGEAKKVVKLIFGSVDKAMAQVQQQSSSALFLEDDPAIKQFVTQKIRKHRVELAEIVGRRYDQWYGCYFGRGMYRWQCENCNQDRGHVVAYYIFKLAVLIGRLVRLHSFPALSPPPPRHIPSHTSSSPSSKSLALQPSTESSPHTPRRSGKTSTK